MKLIITGGAGFTGTNAAIYFSNRGWDVVLFDNLSHKGTSENLNWLKKK